MKYIITVGLPGSGKSTWAKNYRLSNVEKSYKRNKYRTQIIDCDLYFKQYKRTFDSLEEYIYSEIDNIYKPNINEIIIDGLFTTNDDVIRILNNIFELLNIGDEILICQWYEDREQCIKNDLYRRDIDSNVTINNIKYEDIDIEKIRNNVGGIEVEKQYIEVYRKPNYLIFADKYKINYDSEGKFTSDTWSGGGTWGNCWGDSGSISPSEPEDFDEFDELLENVCPNISFLQYKKIKSDCVELDYYNDYDYYGGSETRNFYVCDVENLYNTLVDLNLINEDELLISI